MVYEIEVVLLLAGIGARLQAHGDLGAVVRDAGFVHAVEQPDDALGFELREHLEYGAATELTGADQLAIPEVGELVPM